MNPIPILVACLSACPACRHPLPDSLVTSLFDDGRRTYVTLRNADRPANFRDLDGQDIPFRYSPPFYILDGVRPAFVLIRESACLRIQA